MPSNIAAWLVEKTNPLEVRPAPYTTPGANEIVIKNAAVAVNPVDWKLQDTGFYLTHYPTILGQDVAGEVVEIGSAVTRFQVGDRVLGHAIGMVTRRDCDSAFQHYSVVMDNMSSQISSNMSFEAAAVIPLGFSTAACGMYQKHYLALQHPSVNPKPTGQVLLIWGGSSSVGSNAIQLGISSGYEVITTASTRNFEYIKRLGASQVFDYNSGTIVDDLVDAMKGKTLAGALDCITINGAIEVCAEILRRSQGNRLISTVLKAADDLPGDVKTKWIFGGDLKDNEVGKAVYEGYLPAALAEKKFVPAPEPLVVGKGLEAIQAGLDAQKKGVSARKVVITL